MDRAGALGDDRGVFRSIPPNLVGFPIEIGLKSDIVENAGRDPAARALPQNAEDGRSHGSTPHVERTPRIVGRISRPE